MGDAFSSTLALQMDMCSLAALAILLIFAIAVRMFSDYLTMDAKVTALQLTEEGGAVCACASEKMRMHGLSN